MSAIMPIRCSRNRTSTSNKSGVKQGPLHIASFKLGPTFFALASKTTGSFVEL